MAQHIYSVRLFNGTVVGVRLQCAVCTDTSFLTLIKQKIKFKGTEL